MIRVFIVDDHALMRDGLKALLARAKDIEVIGEAEDGASAVGFVLENSPDVVLMDIKLPGVSGLRAAEKLLFLDPDIRILFLSGFYDRALLHHVIEAGGRGFVVKTSGPSELAEAIRAVYQGERYFSPELHELFSEQVETHSPYQIA